MTWIDKMDKSFTLYSGSWDTFGHISSVGVPKTLNILCNWSAIEFPGNKGLPDAISKIMYPPFLVDFALSLIDSFYMCLPANIQPADHKSIEVEYWRDPINTSGARYHKVTTFFFYCVYIYCVCIFLIILLTSCE